LEDSLRRRGIPFGRRTEARIDVRVAFGDETDLQGAAHRTELVRAERVEITLERPAVAVAAAADDAQRLPRARGRANRTRLPVGTGAPRAADGRTAEVFARERRRENDAEHRRVIFDQSDIDRELAVSLDEFLRAGEGIDEPVARPLDAARVLGAVRLLREHREPR